MNEQQVGPTVLVVGAGPTGLALACGLLRRGVSVAVVDRAPGPAPTSRALGVQPRGVEVLLRLGALSDLPGQVIPLREVRMHVAGELVSSMPMHRMSAASGRSPLLVSQVEVERALSERLAQLGGRPWWGCELIAIDEGPHGVVATLREGDGLRTVRSEWVVGCDGAHSRVRKLAGIGFPGVRVAEHFLIADVVSDWPLDRQVMWNWSRGGEMINVCPLPGAARWRVMGPAPADARGELSEDDILQLVRRQLAYCTPCPDSGIRRVEWLSTFRIHRRLADTYGGPRVLLAGDAVAIHHPFGGQGMNTGLGDAENLAWKLALVALGGAGPRLLESYEAERRPIARKVLAGTGLTTRIVLAESGPLRLLRNKVVIPLMNTAPVQDFLWRNSSQLGITYRRGPLAAAGARRGARPRPGDRVPDLVCRLPDGTHTTLHDALGGRWAVLSASPAPEVVEAARSVLGEDGVIALIIAEPSRDVDLLLVRPDAHLARRDSRSPHAPAALAAWLTHALDLADARSVEREAHPDRTG